ncbi:MAG: hypothetical protein AB1726_17290 [Planctomycetota bacterium]
MLPPCARRRSLLLAALLLVLPPLAAGCVSSGRAPGGDRLRVTVLDYRKGRRFELVGESYGDRVEYYSRKRKQDDAARKYQTDAVMEALLEHLVDLGLDRYAQDGTAPRTGGEVISMAFEVEENGAVRAWPMGRGTPDEEKIQFTLCLNDFLDLYRETQAFQAIDNPEGHDLFRDAKEPASDR